MNFLILASFLSTAAFPASASAKKPITPQAVVEAQAKREGDGCNKFCGYSLVISAVLFNKSAQALDPQSVIRARALSWMEIPSGHLVVVLQHDKMGWFIRAASNAPEDSRKFVSCAADGGLVRRAGKDHLICVTPFADGGRKCTDNKECLGGCVYHSDRAATGLPRDGLSAQGSCKIDDDPYGCITYLSNGKTGGTICKD